MIDIRAEREDDAAAIRAVTLAAFGQSAEADLVEALRRRARPLVSLVATIDGEVVGHIMFSPVTHDDGGDFALMGLAPMAAGWPTE